MRCKPGFLKQSLLFTGVMATAGLLPAIRWVLPLLGLRVPPPAG